MLAMANHSRVAYVACLVLILQLFSLHSFVLVFKRFLTRQSVIRFPHKNPIRIINFLTRDFGQLHKILIRISQDP